jgi:hypothetical protein
MIHWEMIKNMSRRLTGECTQPGHQFAYSGHAFLNTDKMPSENHSEDQLTLARNLGLSVTMADPLTDVNTRRDRRWRRPFTASDEGVDRATDQPLDQRQIRTFSVAVATPAVRETDLNDVEATAHSAPTRGGQRDERACIQPICVFGPCVELVEVGVRLQ